MAEVSLTGYQGPRGFKAEQVYDPTKQLMEAADQDTRIREASLSRYRENVQAVGKRVAENAKTDLEALSQFSSTLSDFLVKYQEKQNDKEYNLGLAEVMNGTVDFPDSTYDQHQKEVAILKTAATADGETANQLEAEGQFNIAQELRKSSPALSGWRAYGQAVGLSKKAALDSQGYLLSFMERTDITVPTPAGPKTPAEIRANGTSAEIDAALAVAQQNFFLQNGLTRINPVVLAENFAPTFQANKAQAKTNVISTVAANNRETAEYDALTNVKRFTVADDATTETLGYMYQDATRNLQILAGHSKGKAAALALQGMVEAAKSMPLDRAEELFKMMESIPKIEGDPESGTLGQLHSDVFRQARAELVEKQEQQNAREEREQNKAVGNIVAQLDLARAQEKDPIKLRQIENESLAALNTYARMGNTSAREALAKNAERNITPEETVRFNNYRDQNLTLDQIDALNLPEEQKNILRNQATDRDRPKFSEKYGSEIKASTKAALLNAAKEDIQFGVDGKPDKNPEAYFAYTQAVEDKLYGWYQGQIRQGIVPSSDEIQSKLESISKQTFVQYYKGAGVPIPLKVPTTFKSATGVTLYDASSIPPREVDPRYSHPTTTKLLSKQETLANLERYRDGETPTQRVKDLYRANDKAFLILQAQHNGIDPTPYVGGTRGQSESDNRNAAPGAAARFYSSSDALRTARAAREMAEARERQSRLRAKGGTQFKVTTPSGEMQAMGDVDILKIALNQGLNEAQAVTMLAIALAESSGIPGNKNLKAPDKSYGLWQINMIGDLGPERRKALGLKQDEQLLDPNINGKAMRYVLGRQGFGAWTVYKTGAYKQYLPDAKRALIALRQEQT